MRRLASPIALAAAELLLANVAGAAAQGGERRSSAAGAEAILGTAPIGANAAAVLPGVTVSDYSPSSDAFPIGVTRGIGDSAGRIDAIAVSADGLRLYAASPMTGVWRSSDGGVSWCQLSSAISCSDGPASALLVPLITDLAVSPIPRNGSRVLAAAAFDTRGARKVGVYRSTDGVALSVGLLAWLIVVAPLQYFVFLVCGAPARAAMRASTRLVACFARGGLERKSIPIDAKTPEGWWDASFSQRPVALTSLVQGFGFFVWKLIDG